MTRNYKCPKCGGEFNEWDKKTVKGDTILDMGDSVIAHAIEKEYCPFCGLERGAYQPPALTFPMTTTTLLESTTVCPICKADWSKGEQCCLGIHTSIDDKNNGGSGAVFVSCPCPRCTPRY